MTTNWSLLLATVDEKTSFRRFVLGTSTPLFLVPVRHGTARHSHVVHEVRIRNALNGLYNGYKSFPIATTPAFQQNDDA